MLLSICMPTYNYGLFIGEALDSILCQLRDDVEVIVLDGGSTDKTKEVVTSRLLRDARLKYYEQSYRGGIDRDIEKVVSLAGGKYCWLFSADDVMLPGAIDRVLREINSNMDIYVCEHALCDLEMNIVSRYPIFGSSVGKRFFDLAVDEHKSDYFRNALNSEAFFSFLSAPIFKKSIWDGVNISESFRGTCWIVAGRLLSAFSGGIKILYLNDVYLYKREGNDSFSNGSLVNRCKIGIQNFQMVAHQIFGKESEEALHIRRVLRRDIPLLTLLAAKLRAANQPQIEDADLLNALVKQHYSDFGFGNWAKFLIFHLSAPMILGILSRLKDDIKNIRNKCEFGRVK